MNVLGILAYVIPLYFVICQPGIRALVCVYCCAHSDRTNCVHNRNRVTDSITMMCDQHIRLRDSSVRIVGLPSHDGPERN